MYLHMIIEYLCERWVVVRDRVRDGCAHHHVSWPQHGRQRCLDCGRYRFVDLAPEVPKLGTRWFRDRVTRVVPGQRAVEVVDQHTQTYCGVFTITDEPEAGR